MPSERAFGGMSDRNRRAGFERRENGLKVTRTSVRNRVIMMAGRTFAEVSDVRLTKVSKRVSRSSAQTYICTKRQADVVVAIDRRAMVRDTSHFLGVRARRSVAQP